MVHRIALRIAVFLSLIALVAPTASSAAPASDAQQELAREKADQLVRTALEFKLEGNPKYHDMLIQMALQKDPQNKMAHWATGHVQVNGKWTLAEDVKTVAQDPKESAQWDNYHRLRTRYLGTPDGEMRLAGLCRKSGWEQAERVHLMRVIRDPQAKPEDQAKAAKRLGLQFYNGQLMSKEQIRQRTSSEERTMAGIKEWSPIARRWVKDFASNSQRRIDRALGELRDVQDPGAILVLELLIAPQSPQLATEVVRIVGRMSEIEATQSLVRQSLRTDSPVVQSLAVEELGKRPLHDYMPLLLSFLQEEIESQYRVAADQNGVIVHDHAVSQRGVDRNRAIGTRFVAAPIVVPVAIDSQLLTDGLAGDQEAANELNDIGRSTAITNQLQRQLAVSSAIYRALQIEDQVAQTNKGIDANNDRVIDIIKATADVDFKGGASECWEWWRGYNDIVAYDVPTDRAFAVYYDSYALLASQTVGAPVQRLSCFAAGTPVWTHRGLLPIEQITVGDLVLAQDVVTGELTYRAVSQTTVRPPSKLLSLQADDVTIKTTQGHPFWIDGVGWQMAKELQVGDELHGVQQNVTLSQITESDEEPAYNLIVEGFHNYFVGSAGILAHDNSYRSPTSSVTPGLQREDAANATPPLAKR